MSPTEIQSVLKAAGKAPISQAHAERAERHIAMMAKCGKPMSDGVDYTLDREEAEFWSVMLSIRAAVEAVSAQRVAA